MNLANLDLDTLRTLVTAVDLGGFGQAAERLGRTPPAISLQMKRLQQDLGVALFRKQGRKLLLTEAGTTALGYARRILALNDELMETARGTTLGGHLRVGCPQDFAPILPDVLKRFAVLYPRMLVELRIDGSAMLLEALSKAQIDVALTVGRGESDATRIGSIDVVWIAADGFTPPREEALPLAMLGPQCAFRQRAVDALTAAGISHRLAATSPSLNGLWAAALGHLGLTARTALGLPSGVIHDTRLFGLPALGSMPVHLQRRAHADGPALERMHALLADATVRGLAQITERSPIPMRARRKRR